MRFLKERMWSGSYRGRRDRISETTIDFLQDRINWENYNTMLEWTAYIKIFTTLLAIVNPLDAIPIFISLTGSMASGERRRIINTASIT